MGAALLDETIEAPKLKTLSPLQALRKHCLWCCCDQAYEVRHCLAESCPLHDWRHGHKPAGGGSTLKAIRAKCLDCSSGNRVSVATCWDTGCYLYDYRDGHNPRRAGIGGRGNTDALMEYRRKHSRTD